jgi:hypothetical protein
MNTRTRTALPLACLLASLAPSCGGGGAASGPAGPAPGPANEGSFSAADFAYQDPHPAGYHPLGTETNALTQFEELLILQPPQNVANARGTLFEEFGAGAGVIAELSDLAGASAYRAAEAGNLDADGKDELVVGRLNNGVPELLILETDELGNYALTDSFDVANLGYQARELRLSLGDVDGDFRDEILVVALERSVGTVSNNVIARVYDDAHGDHALLHEVFWPGSHPASGLSDVQMKAGDLDGDGRDEIVLMALRQSSGLLFSQVSVLEDAQSGYALRSPWGTVKSSIPADTGRGRLLIADFNGDGTQELTVSSFWSDTLFFNVISRYHIRTYDLVEGQGNLAGWPELELASTSNTFENDPLTETAVPMDVAAFDLEADGKHELVAHAPGDTFGELRVYRWDGSEWTLGTQTQGLPAAFIHDQVLSLLATDDDGDGQDELYACTIYGTTNSKTRRVHRYDFGNPSGPLTATWTANVNEPGKPYPPVLVGGEFDGDGLVVRHTGVRFTSLADPVRLVVLSAAPTKSGISQNYGATSTTYSESETTGQTVGVSSGVTASVYNGFDVSDFTDLFGVNARQTISGALTKSQTQTSTQTVTQAFTGPANADTIVFQGTLYQSYEYEILSGPDPTLVGATYTLDVPVETKVYKWTVDYFNQNVDPAYHIGPDVLSHTIGDPASYRSASQVTQLVDDNVGWKIPANKQTTVGQSDAFNTVALTLSDEVQASEELSFDVTWEAGFKVGGQQFGGSFGLTTSSIYTVTFTESTTYQGTVGDISSIADYEQWAYDFGLAVYHHGLPSDASNQPLEPVPGAVPFQVITFWTNPFGFGYGE